MVGYGDTGGASRFFYVSKASSAERNAGLDEFELQVVNTDTPPGGKDPTVPRAGAGRHGPRANVHPTVKPIDLMRWLVRLVTPPGGVVFDPFTGSGTTGCAAMFEHVAFIGVERDPAYARIAEARIGWWERHPDGMALVARLEADRNGGRSRTPGSSRCWRGSGPCSPAPSAACSPGSAASTSGSNAPG